MTELNSDPVVALLDKVSDSLSHALAESGVLGESGVDYYTGFWMGHRLVEFTLKTVDEVPAHGVTYIITGLRPTDRGPNLGSK